MIDVTCDQLETIKRILAKYVGQSEIRIFGSRVSGEAKKYSDLDLAVVGSEKMSLRTKALLNEAFEESDLPFRVDVLDYGSVSDEFKAVIGKKFEVLRID